MVRARLALWLLVAAGLPVLAGGPPRAGSVRFEFTSADPVYLGRDDVARVAGIRPGDPVGPDDLQYAIQNLYALNVFRSVEVYTDDAAAPQVVFRLDPFPMVDGLRWEGVRSIKRRELARTANVVRRMLLTDDMSDSIRAKIVDLYQEQGFLDASASLKLQPAPQGYDLTVAVDEGRRYRCRRPDAEMLDGQLLPEARALLGRLVNRFYARQALDKAQKEIRKIYQQKDYPAIRVEYFIDPDPDAATVTPVFLLDVGPRLGVRVEGHRVGRDDLQKTLAIYRLADVSPFAEEISRDDLASFLKNENVPVAAVRSTRRAAPEGAGEEIVFTVEKGERRRVPLRVEGIEALSRRSVLRGADVPDELGGTDPAVLAPVKGRIEKYYQQRGYMDAVVNFQVSQKHGQDRILAQVSEGALLRLGGVAVITGDVAMPDGLADRLGADRGQPFTADLVEKIRAEVSDRFSAGGYLVESIEVRQTRSGEQVDLEVTPRLGGPYELDNVVVIGRFSTRPSVMRRLIPLQGDRPLDMNGVYRAESGLYSSGIFENVSIEVPAVYGRENARNAVFNLREAPRFTFGYGLGYQEWEKVRGLVEINDGNFLGRGWNAGLLFRLSEKKALVQLSFFDEQILLGKYPFTLSIYALQEDQISYKSQQLSIFAQTSKPLNPISTLFFRLGFENIKNYDLQASYDPSELTREEEPLTLTSFSVNYLRDTRDSLVDPERGTVGSVSVAVAPNIFGVNTGFVKLFCQEQYYRMLVDSVVLAASFRLGWIAPFGGDDPVPISERFFAGGSNTLRGFAVDRAGPLDPETHEPLGGNALVIGNLELRFPIYKVVQGAVFYDVGNVFVDFASARWEDVSHSVGAGLRLKTPFGPIRLDFGYSLKDLPYDKRNQFFITIGNPF